MIKIYKPYSHTDTRERRNHSKIKYENIYAPFVNRLLMIFSISLAPLSPLADRAIFNWLGTWAAPLRPPSHSPPAASCKNHMDPYFPCQANSSPPASCHNAKSSTKDLLKVARVYFGFLSLVKLLWRGIKVVEMKHTTLLYIICTANARHIGWYVTREYYGVWILEMHQWLETTVFLHTCGI